MSNKLKKNKTPKAPQQSRDSVFKEAWENMSEDMAKVLPDFLVKRLQKDKSNVWVVVVVTLVELVVLGLVGKFIYNWLIK